MENKNEIKISVRNLVEFVLRSGDLNSGFTGGSKALALEGTRAHQKLQRSYKEGYIPEVTLSLSVPFKEFNVTIHGRTDGIFSDNQNNVIIDEIKTTTMPLDLIEEEYNLIHWAQAKCYAYIYAFQNQLSQIDVQLTYFHLDTEDIKQFKKTYTVPELEGFIHELLNSYYPWISFAHGWAIKRDSSIRELKFPFEAYRKGQRELAVAAYKTITEKKRIFVQAPTGIGKTISTIFPAVKAMGEGYSTKIFYLTAKTMTRQVAEETFSLLRDKGLELKTLTLTAKEKICFKEEAACNPELCEFAKGHYDRANEAILDILASENMIRRDTVLEYARRHQVCPFEFSLDIALWVDAVVCDYNYVFDPRVYLRRFFLDNHSDYIFLIDEAHNLVDRSRDMFSAELSKGIFLELKKAMKAKDPGISKALGKINEFLLKMKKAFPDKESSYVQKESPKEIYPLLNKLIIVSEEWLKENEKSELHKELMQLYFDCIAFLRIAEFYDDRYVTYMEKHQNDVRIKLFCLDPSFLLSEAIKRGSTAVFFSATLTPIEYFRSILGGSDGDYIMRLPSPFDPDRLCMMIAGNISTKYRNREDSYEVIASYIKVVVDQKKGNYLVFFPSYKYMNEVSERFMAAYPGIKTLIQTSSMLEEERELFLEEFQPGTEDTLVGFAVLGGSFSEGIDLKGERLSGAIIVGVGLPQVCLERDVIMDYFQETHGLGYEYAYMYPGMIKVLQAVGRVIRSEADTGAVLLMDERFVYTGYKRLFPREWSHYSKVSSEEDIAKTLKLFWKKSGEAQ